MKKLCMILGIVFALAVVILIIALSILNQKKFGKAPSGARLERIKKSPNFRDGQFQNLSETIQINPEKGFFEIMMDFFFSKQQDLRPDSALKVVKSDLQHLNPDENLIVWFGHSSYLLQMDQKTFLVDPVFCSASPFSMINKPFEGTDIYSPENMPNIDYLIITHDHWDHLDYETVMRLKSRIKFVICPLGVGEHFEFWGFDFHQIIELDWEQNAVMENGFIVNCLPARHFSGRGLKRNNTLWASFMLQTPSKTVFIGGDGGYGAHFAKIGKDFSVDLAILENGQYNIDWQYIHTMPQYLEKEIRDLGNPRVFTVHHSKYALSKHPWHEPLETETKLINKSFNLIQPKMGEIFPL